MKNKILIFLFILVVPVTVYFLNEELPKRFIASDNRNDSPTSTDGLDHDLSEASPEAFKKAYKYQILKNASLIETSIGPGLQLGLFFMKSSEGNKVFVCEEYPTIDLIFSAEGVAYSGEVPQMIVRGPCQPDTDQLHISALPIPFSQILKSSLTTTEFRFDLPNSSEKISIFFKNVVDFWPTEWVWSGVRLYRKDAQNILSIDGYEIISISGQPVILSAPPNE